METELRLLECFIWLYDAPFLSNVYICLTLI